MSVKRKLGIVFRGVFSSRIRFRVIRKRRPGTRAPTRRYAKHKESARMLVHRKLAEFNSHYGFTYGRVSIRDQRTRWGSCSKKGNLNFNYRIVDLPEHLVDVLIVHELCHLKEFNHSKAFWSLVAETIPDHERIRSELKRFPINANL